MRVPSIVYSGGSFTLSLPLPRWSYRQRALGGMAVSDAGVVADFLRRRDQLIDVRLRYLDSERTAVMTWLETVRNAGVTTFRFDSTDAGTQYTVYVDAPRMGTDELQEEPDDQYLGAWSVALTFRTTTGVRPHVPFLGA
jgi:hypothetical protein